MSVSLPFCFISYIKGVLKLTIPKNWGMFWRIRELNGPVSLNRIEVTICGSQVWDGEWGGSEAQLRIVDKRVGQQPQRGQSGLWKGSADLSCCDWLQWFTIQCALWSVVPISGNGLSFEGNAQPVFRNLPLLHDYQFNYIKVHYCSLPTRDTVCMSSRETELSSHLPPCSSSRSGPLLRRAPEEPENRRQFWRPSCYSRAPAQLARENPLPTLPRTLWHSSGSLARALSCHRTRVLKLFIWLSVFCLLFSLVFTLTLLTFLGNVICFRSVTSMFHPDLGQPAKKANC